MSEVRAMHDSMDGGGRTASGTAVEEQLPEQRSRTTQATCRDAGSLEQRTTPWVEEVEPRREQRSKSGRHIKSSKTKRAAQLSAKRPVYEVVL